MDLDHSMFCKYRPNEDCTHYQKGVLDGDTYYLKLVNQEWYSWNHNDEWEKVDDFLVQFLITNPIVIDKSIKKERKYNWTGVPQNIKYIATNDGGFAFGYEGKPLRGHLHRGFWYGGGEYSFLLWPDENKFNSTNWRYSLERR